MPTDQTIDFVVMFLVIGLLALGLGSMLIGWLVRTWDRIVNHSQGESFEPEPQGSPDFSLLNGDEPRSPGFSEPGELLLNAIEITAIQRMIEHNKTAAKPSKSSSIQAGFGISRGGSSAYQRASAIYDQLFGPPEPAVKYRPLTPEQIAMREGLGLEKR